MFDTLEITGLDLVGQLRAAEHTIAAAQAAQLAIIAELHARSADWIDAVPDGCPEVSPIQVTAAEVSTALRWSTLAATDRVALALTAAERTPRALAALAAGRLTLNQLRALLDSTACLNRTDVGVVEDAVLGGAADQTPAQFRAHLRRAVLRCDPAAAGCRAEKAHRERRVDLFPAEDGIAVLRAVLSAADALRCHGALTGNARADAEQDAAAGVEDDRTLDARRADLLVDHLLHLHPAEPADTSSRPDQAHRPCWATAVTQVHLTVPWNVLAGLSDEPGELTGYGPIDADTARTLAAHDATWRRILTDAATGAVLDVGTTSYHPPTGLADFIRTRDRTCRFPGCRRTARRADLDHTIPYPHGPTSKQNLAALCRPHHRLKTHTGWRVEHHDNGRLEWTSPTGLTYTTDPPETQPADEPESEEEG